MLPENESSPTAMAISVLQSETYVARKQVWHVPLCNLSYRFQGVQGGKGEQGPAGPPGFQVSQPKRTDQGSV